MAEKKQKTFHPFALLKRRKFRIGGYALLTTLLFIGAVVLVNIGVRAVEDRWALRLDLSYNSLTRFSEQTHAALRDLDQDITFYVLAAAGKENPLIIEVLDRYRAANRHISVEVVDPDQNPGLVNAFQSVDSPASFGSNTVIVSNADRSRVKVYSSYELVDYGYSEEYQQYYVRSYNFERLFTQAMLFVTAERTPAVYVLQGHGEIALSDLSAMQTLLSSNNYDVHELALTDELPADDGDVLFVLSPKKDLTDDERDRIMTYLKSGGNMVYVCDVTAPNDLPNFQSLLDYYGVGFEDGMVIANLNDSTQYYPLQPTFLLPLLNDHAIITPLLEANRQIVVVPQTRAIKLPEMDRGEFIVTELLSSKTGSYKIDLSDPARTSVQRQEGDVDGPFPLAVSVQHSDYVHPENESRVVLFGSSATLTAEQMLNSFNNGELLISTVKWATKDEAVNLSIVSKTAQRVTLRIPTASVYYTLGVLVVIILPLSVLVLGAVVWMRRRHL